MLHKILLHGEIMFSEQTFFIHFFYHVKQMQFVTLQSPDSLIQQSVISTNFRKRLFVQIGNLAGHDWWLTLISTTAIVFFAGWLYCTVVNPKWQKLHSHQQKWVVQAQTSKAKSESEILDMSNPAIFFDSDKWNKFYF